MGGYLSALQPQNDGSQAAALRGGCDPTRRAGVTALPTTRRRAWGKTCACGPSRCFLAPFSLPSSFLNVFTALSY